MKDCTKFGCKCLAVFLTWGAATLALALVGHIGRNGWWIAALITGTAATIYGIAAWNEWRDRAALAKRGDPAPDGSAGRSA